MSTTGTTTVWTLGISYATTCRVFEREVKAAAKTQPVYDSQVRVTSQDTVFQLVQVLCEHAIPDRRHDACGIHDHMWKFTVALPSVRLQETAMERLTRLQNGTAVGREIAFGPDQSEQEFGHIEGEYGREVSDTAAWVNMHQTMGLLQTFKAGSKMHLSYGIGSPTHLFLLVLDEQTAAASDHVKLGMVPTPKPNENDQADLCAVAAYSLPARQQIDAAYPQTCQSLLDANHVQLFTLGLSSREHSQDDSVFCWVWGLNEDLFMAPIPFETMDDFFTLSERGWPARNGRPMLVLAPTQAGKQYFENVKERAKEAKDELGLLFKDRNVVYADKVESQSAFKFHQVFPNTAKQLMSGRFRYFRYNVKAGILKVIVGRSAGSADHNAPNSQVLRTWRREFESFHELLCAVEASWFHPETKKPLGDALLLQHDTDLGPSDPFPPKPPCFSKAEEAVYITKEGSRVTALTVAREDNEDETPFVISGHANGSVNKWSLALNAKEWSLEWMEFPVGMKTPRADQETGIRNLAVRHEAKRGHLLYVLGFLQVDNEDDLVNVGCLEYSVVVHILNVANGSRIDQIYVAHPFLGTMVFSNVLYDKIWRDCMLLGCMEGHIIPIHLGVRGGEEMKDWTYRRRSIRQLAVVPKKFLVSVAAQNGSENPKHIFVWSLTNPGTLLSATPIWKPKESSVTTCPFYRLSGTAVYGMKVLVCGDNGDTFLLVDLANVNEQDFLDPQFKGLIRTGDHMDDECGCSGHLTGSGSDVVVVNSESSKPLIFSIPQLATLADKQGLEQDFANEVRFLDEDDKAMRYLRDQAKAVGMVSFPTRGGHKGANDHGSHSEPFSSSLSEPFSSSLSEPHSLDYLDPGPRVLALNGRYLVAGFSGGAIVQSRLLPEEDGRVLTTDYGTNASGTINQGLELIFLRA